MPLIAPTDRVIVIPEEAESVTAGGLIIPEVARTTQTLGIVVSVGRGIEDIKQGDQVVYTQHAGASVEFEGREHFSLHIGEIIAVVER